MEKQREVSIFTDNCEGCRLIKSRHKSDFMCFIEGTEDAILDGRYSIDDLIHIISHIKRICGAILVERRDWTCTLPAGHEHNCEGWSEEVTLVKRF